MCNAVATYRSSDPTRTLTLRRRYAREMRKRFRKLRGLIRTAIITKDVFGIAGGHEGLQGNVLVKYQSPPPHGAFDFPRLDRKVNAFMEWLEEQVDRDILEVVDRRRIGQSINQTWQNVYIQDTYKRGVQRATYEMGQAGFTVDPISAQGGLQAVMSQATHVDRLGVMYSRAFNELKGITDAMGQQVSRVLTQGLADGDGPRLIARKLNATIGGRGATPGQLGITDTLGRFIPAQRRAEMLARTETIRAHHQGMMQTYRNWGAEGVKVQAELRTAGDLRVCPECDALEGTFFTLDQAQGLIPVHPMCRCIVLPARPEDVGDSQVRGETDPLDVEGGDLGTGWEKETITIEGKEMRFYRNPNYNPPSNASTYFHGTKAEHVPNIVENGLDPNVTGQVWASSESVMKQGIRRAPDFDLQDNMMFDVPVQRWLDEDLMAHTEQGTVFHGKVPTEWIRGFIRDY